MHGNGEKKSGVEQPYEPNGLSYQKRIPVGRDEGKREEAGRPEGRGDEHDGADA